MSKIILTVKNQCWMSLVKLDVSIICFISRRKENYSLRSLLSGDLYFRGSLLLAFANTCEILSLLSVLYVAQNVRMGLNKLLQIIHERQVYGINVKSLINK